jgi:hypothetical protein
MVSQGHCGLKRFRRIVLKSVDNAARTGNPMFLRMRALLSGEHRRSPDHVAYLMGRAADAGDPIAQYWVGAHARDLGLDQSDPKQFERSYQMLLNSTRAGCVEAMVQLGKASVEDIHDRMGSARYSDLQDFRMATAS